MPIIGGGDIASVLPESDKLFFASGVSNSQETRESEYRREIDLLFAQPRGAHLVYFGSMAVFYSDSRYAEHKRQMEQMVQGLFPRYTIVRIGNIDWGTNPHTLINHFKLQRLRGEKLEIQDTFRYVTSKEEFLYWIYMIPEWSCEMNVIGIRMTIKEIVEKYVYGKE